MDLYKVARQLFEVLDLTEAPETSWEEEEYMGYISAAEKQILPEDQIPDDLKEDLEELGYNLKEQVNKVNEARKTIEGKKEKLIKEKKEKLIKEKKEKGLSMAGYVNGYVDRSKGEGISIAKILQEMIPLFPEREEKNIKGYITQHLHMLKKTQQRGEISYSE